MVPEICTTLPTRTAREYPTSGSHFVPPEMFFRSILPTPTGFQEGHAFSLTNREIECRVDVHGRSIDKLDAIVLKGRASFHPRKGER